MITTFDQLRAEGHARGRVEGRVEEARALLLRLLRLRFSPITAGIEERVGAADLATLERWFERSVTTATLERVFEA